MSPTNHHGNPVFNESVGTIEYKYYPLKDRFSLNVTLLSVAVCLCFLIWFKTDSVYLVIVLATLLLWSLRTLLFPTTCCLNADGISLNFMGSRRFYPWNCIVSFQITRYGVRFQMTPTWYLLLVFAAPFLPTTQLTADEVLMLIREIIPQREKIS